LGIKLKALPIQELFDLNLNLLYENIFPKIAWDITEENLQSRIRSNILMAISNKMNYMLLSTGNKSEMSMGYSTIYGDLAGGFAPLKDITKTMVYKLCTSYNKLNPKNKIPNQIITREPTAELRHDQKDSDTLPSYEILDEVLNLYIEKFWTVHEISNSLGVSKSFVRKIVNLVQRNEFKRRQGPPGVKVTDISFGKDRRFPITNGFENF
jgi:NAD+ synthase (glutamine-hydrolysing)